jgi:hypothetical protein
MSNFDNYEYIPVSLQLKLVAGCFLLSFLRGVWLLLVLFFLLVALVANIRLDLIGHKWTPRAHDVFTSLVMRKLGLVENGATVQWFLSAEAFLSNLLTDNDELLGGDALVTLHLFVREHWYVGCLIKLQVWQEYWEGVIVLILLILNIDNLVMSIDGLPQSDFKVVEFEISSQSFVKPIS